MMEHQHRNQQFTCPMHPEVVKDAPGKCPKCGMDLIPISNSKGEHSGHQHHRPHESGHEQHDMKVEKHSEHKHQQSGHSGHAHHAGMIDDYKKRFYIVLVLTIPIMALSPMIQRWLGVDWMFTGSSYVLLLLSSIVYFYGGWPFLIGLKDEVKSKSPGMMTLVAVAITVAYVYSVAIVLGLTGMDFFWELATLILIMLLGHWIEMKSIMSASRELELLVQLMPSEAHLIHGEHITEVKTEDLKAGDIILIKPGEKIAADGIITEGNSYLNESMLTGESKPVEKSKGEKVIAGSINGNGSLKVEVSHGSKDSYL
ncbi:MAG TPA: HAD-IC family P-type ATPase, partial [Cyclobacteriaceae bacterium]|nr:HAD-IC family P-type ATPase [Cyclobacteriaceae bacterium]